MEKKSDILSRIDRRTGMTVPDGYFADFAKNMALSLPHKEVTELPRRSFWQKARPFVYMAAMFAGIWCMMKMFTLMGGANANLDIEHYPGVTTALSNDHFVNEYVAPDVDQFDIYDDLFNQEDITPEEFFDFDPEAESGIDGDENFVYPDQF